jgi:hypothetical protein
MRKMAKEIASIIIEEQGTAKFIARLSDPYWFQAFGCVLAYDWHSSGVTTWSFQSALHRRHNRRLRRQAKTSRKHQANRPLAKIQLQQTIDEFTYPAA